MYIYVCICIYKYIYVLICIYTRKLDNLFVYLFIYLFIYFGHISLFSHDHLRFTGQHEKGEDIFLTPLYRFHPLHRRFNISRMQRDFNPECF